MNVFSVVFFLLVYFTYRVILPIYIWFSIIYHVYGIDIIVGWETFKFFKYERIGHVYWLK